MNLELKRIADRIAANPCEASGDLYHPLPFPEFDRLTTSSRINSAYRKWKLIESHLRRSAAPQNARILDVGANAGFYAFSFVKAFGGQVDAYEPLKHYAEIGEQIVQATSLPVTWYNKPLDFSDLTDRQYDIALMLSVFQWMSEGDNHLTEATELLRQVAARTNMLFFELGCNAGKSAIHTTERPILWIWRLLTQNTFPKEVAYLGSISAWGSANRYLFVCSPAPIRLTLNQRLVTGWLRRRLPARVP